MKYYNLWNESYNPKIKIVCPFHDDVNASMLIDVEQNKWFCFGCQRGGGSLELIQAAEPDKTSIQHYQKLFGIVARVEGNRSLKRDFKPISEKEQRKLERLNLSKAGDYYNNLNSVNWLVQTGPEIEYMVGRGYTAKTLNKAGAKIAYNNDYPIIFPLRDSGQFVGWLCRTINPEVEKRRKYLYNRGFARQKCLIGRYDNAEVLIVEGYLDYLKAKQFGIKYVCATLGWKASIEQMEKLKRAGVRKIICGLDSDNCGRKGFKFLKQNFKSVVPLVYPVGIKDFGDMSEKGLIKIKNIIGGCY